MDQAVELLRVLFLCYRLKINICNKLLCSIKTPFVTNLNKTQTQDYKNADHLIFIYCICDWYGNFFPGWHLLMYSSWVRWKCGHYPSFPSHIVAPVGSIHPSKVYSWGQASAACIINRTELSAVHRIRLHLASSCRSELRKHSNALNAEKDSVTAQY